jgi:hypothetical protein
MRRKIQACICFAVLLAASMAHAQSGQPAVTTTTSGTISTTNVFQQLQAQTNTRRGCTIQNQGTHTMYVFFGSPGSALVSSAYQIAALQTIMCATGNIILSDAIQITGTAGDAFVLTSQ